MIQFFAATVLTAHGLIHLVGFVVPWGIARLDGFAYRTTAFGGAVDLGADGARLLGVAWLALTMGFVGAGIAAGRGARWARALAAALSVASLVVCAMGLPEAVAGLVVNIGILVVVAILAVRARPAVRHELATGVAR